jgi:hypothetical protein
VLVGLTTLSVPILRQRGGRSPIGEYVGPPQPLVLRWIRASTRSCPPLVSVRPQSAALVCDYSERVPDGLRSAVAPRRRMPVVTVQHAGVSVFGSHGQMKPRSVRPAAPGPWAVPTFCQHNATQLPKTGPTGPNGGTKGNPTRLGRTQRERSRPNGRGRLEGLVPARAWGFKSPLRHSLLYAGVGDW